MAITVKEIQPTPNPNAMKFVLEKVIFAQPASFFKADDAKDHPLASKLFAVAGVSSVLLLGDFVTVNKSPSAKWSQITAKVKRILAEA